MPKIVKLKLSSSALSQFPELPTELHKKDKTGLKSESLKQKYAPNESSPLAQPKPIKAVPSQESVVKSEAVEAKVPSGLILTIPKMSDAGSVPQTPQQEQPQQQQQQQPATAVQQDVPSRSDTPVSRPTGPSRVGLTMNATTVVELDKSGAPARKWTRGVSKIKSFSGYLIPTTDWKSTEKPREVSTSSGDEKSSGKESKVKKDKSEKKGEESTPDVKAEESSAPSATPITA